MKYTEDFKLEVKAWYFENGEKVNETARHFSISPQQVCRWRDREKAREKARVYENSPKRKAYLEEHKEYRNEYLRRYRKTEAGKEAEKRSRLKKTLKVKKSSITIQECSLPFIDRIIDDNTFEYDNILWKVGALGYIRGGKNFYYHRYIYEKSYKVHIDKGWQVHHIDQNKLNNNLDNLVCVPDVVHNYLHFLLRSKKLSEYQELIKSYKKHN